MSFLTDLFEGHTSNLGTDLAHAGSSLMSHPSQLYETLGGAAALATGGLALGGLGAGGLFGGADAAAGGGGLFSGLFGGGGDIAVAAGGDSAALDAITAGAEPTLAPAVDAASVGGGTGLPASFGGLPTGIATAPDAALGAAGGGGATPAGFASTEAEQFGAVTGAGGAAPTGAAPSGGSSFLSSLSPSNWTLGGVGKVAGAAAAGVGLGMDVLNRNQMDPNQAMLAQKAAQLGQQGQVLASYLKTGTLPPALKAQLDQAVAADKARIVAGYAAKGMPTDPNQNSALAQDLNNLQIQSVAAMADAQIQMLNTGLKETGMSTDIYNILTKLDLAQNQQLMSAISSFAAALGGGMGGTQPAKLSLA
jgi:hypothetical protein